MSEQDQKNRRQEVTSDSQLYLWEVTGWEESHFLFQTLEDKGLTGASVAKCSLSELGVS